MRNNISEKAGSQTEAFKSQVWVISRGNKEAKTVGEAVKAVGKCD